MFRRISPSLLGASLIATAVTAGSSGAFAQGAMPPDAIYQPVPGQPAPTGGPSCPGIQWYLARSANGHIWGYFFFTDASGVSKADGTVDRRGNFKITLVSLSGNGPVGVATGRRGPQGLINGTLNGEGCSRLHLDMSPSQPMMGPSAG